LKDKKHKMTTIKILETLSFSSTQQLLFIQLLHLQKV